MKIEHIWFWNDQFREPELHGKHVEVRQDPWDPGTCYALLHGRWQQCISKFKSLLRDLTSVELRHYLDVLVRRHGLIVKDLSPERVAEWIMVRGPKNFDPRIAAQQAEARSIYEPLAMTNAISERKILDLNPTPVNLSSCAHGSELEGQELQLGADNEYQIEAGTSLLSSMHESDVKESEIEKGLGDEAYDLL